MYNAFVRTNQEESGIDFGLFDNEEFALNACKHYAFEQDCACLVYCLSDMPYYLDENDNEYYIVEINCQ